MEENIKIISDMCQGIFGVIFILAFLLVVNVVCILFITNYISQRNDDFLNSKKVERITRKQKVDDLLSSHSLQLKYLYDEINKLNKPKKHK